MAHLKSKYSFKGGGPTIFGRFSRPPKGRRSGLTCCGAVLFFWGKSLKKKTGGPERGAIQNKLHFFFFAFFPFFAGFGKILSLKKRTNRGPTKKIGFQTRANGHFVRGEFLGGPKTTSSHQGG